MSGPGPLDFLYNPASVGMVGVSAAPGKIGSRILGHLIDNGYAGRVYPVNPAMDSVRGLRCYPDAGALPEPVDVAYILVPADAAVEATWTLGRAGAKAAIIAAAGFAEAGTDQGRAREQSLADAMAATGIRIVGPNCNGIYNAHDSVSIGFNTAHGLAHPPGGMGVISHSGALFSTLMLRAARLGVGLSKFASIGNEADLNVLDFMDDLACDQVTSCICLIIDSLPDGGRFEQIAARARGNGKRVVALKLGTTAAGASAAVAHSSRLAGRAEAYQALFQHCGVGTVDTIEQLVTAAALVDSTPPVPPGPRLGVVTMSGGAGTIVADSAVRHGVAIPPLSAVSMGYITAAAPGSPAVNPVDLGAVTGRIDFSGVLRLLRDDAGTNTIVQYYHPMFTDAERTALAQALTAGAAASGKPHILLAPGGIGDAERAYFREHAILVVGDTDECMAALAAAGAQPPPGAAASGAQPRTPPGGAAPPGIPMDGAALEGLPEGGGVIGDAISLGLLRAAGLPVVPFAEADSPVAAATAAAALGYPVVVKGLVGGVAHKSDFGLVVTGVRDPAGCARESARLLAAGASGLLIQAHLEAPVEALAGLITEPNLGRFLVFGLGGVLAESLADTAVVPVTADQAEITAALAATRLGAVLRSPRLRLPGAFDALTGVLARLAVWGRTADPRIAAVDMNPVLVNADGAIAVDALIVLADVPEAGPRARALRRDG